METTIQKPLNQILLSRIGNKQKLAKKIFPYIPKHDVYIEPFFGAGGLFFYKPKVKYNLLNDLDNEVYNFWMVIRNYPDEFYKKLEITPYHRQVFEYWKNNKETDPVWRAVRFIYLSNFSFLGMNENLKLEITNAKTLILNNIYKFNKFISGCSFWNKDYKEFLKNIHWHKEIDKQRAFIYTDPPYVGTVNNYELEKDWTITDLEELLDVLINYNVRFAVSEFANPDVIQIAKNKGLKIVYLGDRRTLENRNMEILIINYQIQQKLFIFD